MYNFSPYLLAIVIAWAVAHTVKYSLARAKNPHINLVSELFISGGMPSSHAATSLAVWTVVLLRDGPGSGLFGLATLVAMVFCYDAVKVRRSSGEQGEAIRLLIKEQKSHVPVPRIAKGHTPLEVFVGALLGCLVGIVVFLATK